MPFAWNAEVESWMPVLVKDHVVFLARLKGLILVKFHFEYLHSAYFNSPEISTVHCVLLGFCPNVSVLPRHECISVARSIARLSTPALSTPRGSALLLFPLLTQLLGPCGPFHGDLWKLPEQNGLSQAWCRPREDILPLFCSSLRYSGKKCAI